MEKHNSRSSILEIRTGADIRRSVGEKLGNPKTNSPRLMEDNKKACVRGQKGKSKVEVHPSLQDHILPLNSLWKHQGSVGCISFIHIYTISDRPTHVNQLPLPDPGMNINNEKSIVRQNFALQPTKVIHSSVQSIPLSQACPSPLPLAVAVLGPSLFQLR